MADQDQLDDPTGDIPLVSRSGAPERRPDRRWDVPGGPDPARGAGGETEAERDPTALAAWRRVAEQRRRRYQPDGSVDPQDVREAVDAPDDGAGSADGAGDAVPDRHEFLLGLAGRVDDDALSWARELVAVDDDAGAAELLGGCLLAGRVGLTGVERQAVDRWFAGARVDPELVAALPADPEAGRRRTHRFAAEVPGVPGDVSGLHRDGEAVARVAQRLPGVRRVRQCWRLTPAGSAPGPVPHRVVLVETDSTDDRAHVTHHVAHAARSLGAVSVEVFATGASLPAYHRAALAVAVALTPDSRGTSSVPSGPTAPAAAAAPPVPPRAPGVPTDEPDERWRTVADSRPGGPGRRGGADGADRRHARPAAPEPAPEPADEPADEAELPALADLAEDTQPVAPETDRAASGSDEVVGTAPDVDLDADGTAARIAALWRQPAAIDALDAPLSGPLEPTDLEPAAERPEPDPDATGSFPAVTAPGPETTPDATRDTTPDSAAPPDPGRLRRARHSRGDADADTVDVDPPTPPSDPDARGGMRSGLSWAGADSRTGTPPELLASPVEISPVESGREAGSDTIGPGTASEGRRPDRGDDDPATGPVGWAPSAGPPGHRGTPLGPVPSDDPGGWRDPTPTDPTPAAPTSAAPTSAAPTPAAPTPAAEPRREPHVDLGDTGDAASSQLSEREWELLARLHEELAARERLDPSAVDPLTRREAQEPRTEDHRRPLVDREPGRAGGQANGHVNGYVNGHDLPRRYGPSSGEE